MPSQGQEQALEQLWAVEEAGDGSFSVVSTTYDTPWLVVDVSIDTRGYPSTAGGIRLRDRERFELTIPQGFPFAVPTVRVRHARWAGAPHVQWVCQLCLYQAPGVEWDPSDGMFGYIDRLLSWLARASLDELDPVGAPLHPPVAYTTPGTPTVIPRVDTPAFTGVWCGLVDLHVRNESRVDLGEWHGFADDFPPRAADRAYGAVILLSDPLPFEYPRTMAELLAHTSGRGVTRAELLTLLRIAAFWNEEDTPLYVVVGTPMRGVRGRESAQHLATWRVSAAIATGLRNTLERESDTDDVRVIRGEIAALVSDWADSAELEWCTVREARPEVTRDRAEGSPLRWFHGKTVAVWGCGALGSHVAESVVRAGAKRVVLRDSGTVAPGILARQAFDDADLGRPKAFALADRLRRINPDVIADPETANILTDAGIRGDWTDGCNLVIDTTASASVHKYLERERSAQTKRVPFASMLVGYRADRSLLVYSSGAATGAAADLLRKARLRAARDRRLRSFDREFWPNPPRTEMFQPEPGCSEPTFTGAGAEITALANQMLWALAHELDSDVSATVMFSELPRPAEERAGAYHRSEVPNDAVVPDLLSGYQVRVAPAAVAEMEAWIRRTERLTPGKETGGLLFGYRDDASRTVWVSDVLGPPPDSRADETGFVCGTAGVDEAALVIKVRSGGASVPLGMWHTHPGGTAKPSDTDMGGMRQLVDDEKRPLPKQLLLIVGGDVDRRTFGAWLYQRRAPMITAPMSNERLHQSAAPNHRIGLALSGGGFRAVAFHLGAMRALHDRGVLDHITVVSGVSGGSVLAAMYAYAGGSFTEFDERVTELLRSGLVKDIARALLLTRRAPQTLVYGLATMLSTGVVGGGKLAVRAAGRAGLVKGAPAWEPPFVRSVTRTTALEDVFTRRLFGDATIDRPERPVEVVINACDLRSGQAFRFGSRESGCARYGRMVDNRVAVARAVAASAAFPIALPAIDSRDDYVGFDGERRRERTVLTDGGVYDNLGTTPLEPGRSARYSTNVHPVDYVVNCDAGYGVMDAKAFPLVLPSRLVRSFGATYRKVQDSQKSALHAHQAHGGIDGFAMAFLGQRDGNLPICPPDLVPRERVVDYPTNFSAMSREDLAALTLRGEQLMRLVIEHHCPEIA